MVRLKRLSSFSFLTKTDSFNSSMVRLKLNQFSKDQKIELSFNSSMVRLKLVTGLITIKMDYCFNSSMVRLKPQGDVLSAPIL
mgnify:CR=1 FL=1